MEGLVLLMNSNYSRPVNLGNPEEHSMNEFAVKIRDIVGGNSKIINLPPVTDDPRRRRPDISLAKNLLSWEPKVCCSLAVFLELGCQTFLCRCL